MRKKILKGSIWLAIIAILFFGCCLDSENNIPIIAILISEAWLMLMYAANK